MIAVSFTFFKQLMNKWVLLFWKFAKNKALLYYVNLILIMNKTKAMRTMSSGFRFPWFYSFRDFQFFSMVCIMM